jgi:hypothetical protein
LAVVASKKNPLAAELSVKEQEGAPEYFLGSVDFKILHREGQTGLISGALLNKAGRRIGQVSIDGFPLGALPDAKGPGRPPDIDKKLAVLLAWALRRAELGGKRKAGEADKATAEMFAYRNGEGGGNAKTVRDIRAKMAEKFELDLDKDLHCIIDESKAGEGPPVCSILIEKPTIYDIPGGGLEILGARAIAWEYGMRGRVARLPAFRIVIGETEPGDGIADLKARRGPKIISIIRPGR